MTAELIDRRHLAFVLDKVLHVEQLFALPAFAAHDRESAGQILETAEAVARDAFLPSYALCDANEPRMENGRVVLPGEIKQALDAFRTQGFTAMTAPAEIGGLGLPRTVANAAFLWFQAANISIANYAMLSFAAAELLSHHGTPEQQARYMAPLLEGRFFGTMALSEPHAGSSLGDIRTSARRLGDGRYALSGTKMWISGGEHDMAETIVHLMLARIDGAPAGVKGISLFIVPRHRLDADGRPSVWNHVALAGLNHKMGQRGTVNTVLNVGEGGETIGEIVGEPGQGLAQMFTMMNEARIGVAMGAVAHASAGFRHSLAYARDRLQGRHPDAKDPASPQVPLVEHADVRRMLLDQKAAAEGGIALALYLARLADLKLAAPSEVARREAALLLDFLTPIFKSWISEACLGANDAAIQVLGGAGYTRDHPLEQHYRDNRLNPIHEGTNGIQALDLIGRKAVMADGAALRLYRGRLETTLAGAQGIDALATLARDLMEALDRVDAAALHLTGMSKRDGARAALSHARDFMEIAGTTTFAWIWLEQARVAMQRRSAVSEAEKPWLDGLIATARHVFAAVIPRGAAALARIEAGPPAYFAVNNEMLG